MRSKNLLELRRLETPRVGWVRVWDGEMRVMENQKQIDYSRSVADPTGATYHEVTVGGRPVSTFMAKRYLADVASGKYAFDKPVPRISAPYCIVDGIVHQLVWSDPTPPDSRWGGARVLRFPDDGREMPDLNQMAIDYFNGISPLSDRWEYTVNSGSSYSYTYGLFAARGVNSHMVTQGKEPCKKFKLYIGKSYSK